MNRLAFAALSAVAAIAVVPLLAQQSPMRAGRYEILLQMEIPNAPVKMPEMRSERCVTQAQIDDPTSAVPALGDGSSCKISDYMVDGNTVTWKMTCTGAQAMSGDGELTFDGDAYKGRINATTAQGPVQFNLAGKRLGACEK